MPHPKSFSSFSREWGELLFQTKFLAVGTSLGDLSMKSFTDWSYHLVPKIGQRKDAVLPIFLTMKMPFNLDKIWCENLIVSRYMYIAKKIDNTIKDNVTVTSSNFSPK